MFEDFRSEFALRRLQRERRRLIAWYEAEDSKLLKQPGNLEKIQRLYTEQMHETATIDDQVARLQTNYLRDQAQHYLVPMPEFNTDTNGAWEKATTTEHYQLKTTALVELRSAIRKERRERREHWQSWAALTIGLVGALIGLFSAISRHC
jgi:hypothetical protein